MWNDWKAAGSIWSLTIKFTLSSKVFGQEKKEPRALNIATTTKVVIGPAHFWLEGLLGGHNKNVY